MFQRIKSPVGEVVSPWSYWNDDECMTEENAQYCYVCYKEPFYNTDGLHPLDFEGWLEGTRVRLL